MKKDKKLQENNMLEIIKFYDVYYDAIINGVKTQTMRMPQSRIDVTPLRGLDFIFTGLNIL